MIAITQKWIAKIVLLLSTIKQVSWGSQFVFMYFIKVIIDGMYFCDSWGRKELDMTERLNLTELRSNISSLIKIGTVNNQHIFVNKK